jgi:hypothetical protein
MKIVVKYFPDRFPALLRMSIHHAPHRRMHLAVIQQYRVALYEACKAAGVPVPLDEPTDLDLFFVDPASPDRGGSYLAFEQAVDGKTLKGPAVFADDGLIARVTMDCFWPTGAYDRLGKVRRKGAKVS